MHSYFKVQDRESHIFLIPIVVVIPLTNSEVNFQAWRLTLEIMVNLKIYTSSHSTLPKIQARRVQVSFQVLSVNSEISVLFGKMYQNSYASIFSHFQVLLMISLSCIILTFIPLCFSISQFFVNFPIVLAMINRCLTTNNLIYM